MTHMPAASSYVLWLIAVNFSPGFASRTMIRRPASFAKSNACSGWPHSIIT